MAAKKSNRIKSAANKKAGATGLPVRAIEIDAYLRSLGDAKDSCEGVLFGDPHAQARGILCVWKTTTDAIEEAARQGCNVILTHEALFDPAAEACWAPAQGQVVSFMAWKGNLARTELLIRHGITVVRSHGTADALCIQEAVMRELGFEPRAAQCLGIDLQTADIAPTPLGALGLRAKERLGMPAIRVAGDPALVVTRVGNGWGGLSLARHVDYLEALRLAGCQAIIAGESEEHACQYIQDAGIGLVELGHAGSENIGIKRLSLMLAGHFRAVKVGFYAIRPAFRWM